MITEDMHRGVCTLSCSGQGWCGNGAVVTCMPPRHLHGIVWDLLRLLGPSSDVFLVFIVRAHGLLAVLRHICRIPQPPMGRIPLQKQPSIASSLGPRWGRCSSDAPSGEFLVAERAAQLVCGCRYSMQCGVAHSTFQVIENPVSLSRLAQELLVLITAVAWMYFSSSGSIHRGQASGCLRNAAVGAAGAEMERELLALRRLSADPDCPIADGTISGRFKTIQGRKKNWRRRSCGVECSNTGVCTIPCDLPGTESWVCMQVRNTAVHVYRTICNADLTLQA